VWFMVIQYMYLQPLGSGQEKEHKQECTVPFDLVSVFTPIVQLLFYSPFLFHLPTKWGVVIHSAYVAGCMVKIPHLGLQFRLVAILKINSVSVQFAPWT
jgi:hypothetical protein